MIWMALLLAGVAIAQEADVGAPVTESQSPAAQESAPEATETIVVPDVTPARRSAPIAVQPKKGKNQKREKETEGTEALNRFKTQAPLESHYTFGGERLEVDPD